MSGNGWVILPLACLSAGAFVVYLVARLVMPRIERARNALLAVLTALILSAALGAMVPVGMMVKSAMVHRTALPEWSHFGPGQASLRAEPGALVVAGVALGLGVLVTVYSARYLALDQRYETYYPLLLMLATGLLGMVQAADLFNLYLFCELMSLAAYALVAFRRHTDTAIEAGFKYLIMGSVGTAIMLMGISFLYRARGHLSLPATLPAAGLPAARLPGTGLWGRVGLACVMVGLAVKSAIVPMHTWLPDAHGRAPSSISAMLSGIVIQSAFYTLLKVSLGLGFPAAGLGTLLILLAVLNMTLGNGMALVQTNTKRLLGYSTIAQMGYVMLSIGIGLHYGAPAAIQAGFFLLLAHAAMKGLAFLCKGVCHFYNGSTTVEQLRGTSTQLPLVAVALGLALAGLAGVPPLAGFAGKWLILTQALGTASRAGGPAYLVYAGLAFFLLNSVSSLGYFLPLIGTLFAPPAQRRGERGERTRISAWMAAPLVFLGGLVLAIGIYPGPWLNWMAHVGAYLLPGS